MNKKFKIGRNSNCPCGSGKKYKICCYGKVNWEDIISKKDSEIAENMTLRGKNLWFYNIIADALQLNKIGSLDNKTLKKACTPRAVKHIHSAISEVWPNDKDLERIIINESKTPSALYIGFYEPISMMRGITRHSLYSEKILLVDTFMDSRITKEQFNPVIHPEQHIENTLKDIRLWFTFYPWVEAGIVNFIKNPCDFDLKLNHECLDVSKKKFDSSPLLQKSIGEWPDEYKNEMKEWYMLSHPDFRIKEILRSIVPEISEKEINEYIKYIHKKRDDHPFFIPFVNEDKKQVRSPLLAIKTGANYEMAKLIASATNSHLITDMEYRWREIELDHHNYKIDQKHWNSFSKAFQNIGVSFLNNVSLNNALEIRRKEYLTGIRQFLSRIWSKCSSENLYDEKNIKYLENELVHHLNEAQNEWNTINKKFYKHLGIGSSTLVAAAPVIMKGSAEYLIGSLIVNGLTQLGILWHDKYQFPKKFPASFFLKMNK